MNLDPHMKALADILVSVCVRELIARRADEVTALEQAPEASARAKALVLGGTDRQAA